VLKQAEKEERMRKAQRNGKKIVEDVVVEEKQKVLI